MKPDQADQDRETEQPVTERDLATSPAPAGSTCRNAAEADARTRPSDSPTAASAALDRQHLPPQQAPTRTTGSRHQRICCPIRVSAAPGTSPRGTARRSRASRERTPPGRQRSPRQPPGSRHDHPMTGRAKSCSEPRGRRPVPRPTRARRPTPVCAQCPVRSARGRWSGPTISATAAGHDVPRVDADRRSDLHDQGAARTALPSPHRAGSPTRGRSARARPTLKPQPHDDAEADPEERRSRSSCSAGARGMAAMDHREEPAEFHLPGSRGSRHDARRDPRGVDRLRSAGDDPPGGSSGRAPVPDEEARQFRRDRMTQIRTRLRPIGSPRSTSLPSTVVRSMTASPWAEEAPRGVPIGSDVRARIHRDSSWPPSSVCDRHPEVDLAVVPHDQGGRSRRRGR